MASTWGLDMNSKWIHLFLFGLCLCGRSLADTLPEVFVETSLGRVPAEQQLLLQGDADRAVRAAYGGRYPAASIPYWQSDGVRVWVLRARGKFGYIQAGFVVEGGRLVKSEVLSSKEKKGRVIKQERFLRQLAGIGLTGKGTLDRCVDGYSGATISVSAMEKMARLALTLDGLVARR